MRHKSTSEVLSFVFSILLGLALAIYLAPLNSKYFWPNFLFYWLPQIAIIVLPSTYKPPRRAFFSGVTIALVICLGLHSWWMHSREHPDSLAWLGYLFSLPGALAGMGFIQYRLKNRQNLSGIMIFMAVAGFTLIGIAVNQVLICSTVMYCLGK